MCKKKLVAINWFTKRQFLTTDQVGLKKPFPLNWIWNQLRGRKKMKLNIYNINELNE